MEEGTITAAGVIVWTLLDQILGRVLIISFSDLNILRNPFFDFLKNSQLIIFLYSSVKVVPKDTSAEYQPRSTDSAECKRSIKPETGPFTKNKLSQKNVNSLKGVPKERPESSGGEMNIHKCSP